MKRFRKFIAYVLALTVAVGCFAVSPMETEAAAKTTTTVYDSKKGVWYPTKSRTGLMGNTSTSSIYLLNEGDYVASIKTSSPNLIAKITGKVINTGNCSTGIQFGTGADATLAKVKSYYTITHFAKKKGTYTLTVTIKNAQKKTTCKKKIKIYADEYSVPVKSISYAGVPLLSYSTVTKKQTGKLCVALNKGYKLQKIEVGTYPSGEFKNMSAEPVYKKVKNKSKISLATSGKYTDNIKKSIYSESGVYVDFLYPVTHVKITYKDTKLGILRTQEYQLYYQNK